MKAWKRAEKEVAEFFGGLRRIRIRYDESIGDVIHPTYSIEVKYGNQVPKCLTPRIPTELRMGRKKYRLVPSKFCEVSKNLLFYKTLWWVKKKTKKIIFLEDAMSQARKYQKKLKPLVCVKPRRRHGFIIIWEV